MKKLFSRFGKRRYYNTAQFFGLATALVLLGLTFYLKSVGAFDACYFVAGAFVMRIFTLRRFY